MYWLFKGLTLWTTKYAYYRLLSRRNQPKNNSGHKWQEQNAVEADIFPPPPKSRSLELILKKEHNN